MAKTAHPKASPPREPALDVLPTTNVHNPGG
jgi:hypothetical protein